MTDAKPETLVQEFEALSEKLVQILPGKVENEVLRQRARDIAQSTTKRLRSTYEFASAEAWAVG